MNRFVSYGIFSIDHRRLTYPPYSFFYELVANYTVEKNSTYLFGCAERSTAMGMLAGFAFYRIYFYCACTIPAACRCDNRTITIFLLHVLYTVHMECGHYLVDH